MKRLLGILLVALILASAASARYIKATPNSIYVKEVAAWITKSNIYQHNEGATGQILFFSDVVYDTKTKELGFFVEFGFPTVKNHPAECQIFILNQAALKKADGWPTTGENVTCPPTSSIKSKTVLPKA